MQTEATKMDYARTAMRMLVIVLRHRGKKQALKGDQIGEMLGTEARVVAEFAGILTQEGYWICSGGEGYWYAESESEWRAHQLDKEMERGRKIIQKVVKAKKNSQLIKQEQLFETVRQVA